MHTTTFNSEEKLKLQEIANINTTVAIAISHLSKKAKTKKEKRRRLLAKDICTAALKKSA